MSATPRSARLSSPGEVAVILVASALAWIVLIGALFAVFFAVLIPAVEFSGRGDIPSDFPVYPGAHLDSAIASRFQGCTSVDATWSTTATGDAVMAFYRQQLAGDWTITDTGPSRIDFQSTTGPARTGTIYLSTNQLAHQTAIELMLSTSPAGSNVRCISGTAG